MDDMQELVSIEAVERLFQWAAILGPPCGVILGGALGRWMGGARRGAARGLLIGLLGPANWLLWRMYSALTDRLGLDSVANLLLNLAIFVSIGLSAGVAYGLMLRRHAGAVAAAEGPGGGGRHGEEDTGG